MEPKSENLCTHASILLDVEQETGLKMSKFQSETRNLHIIKLILSFDKTSILSTTYIYCCQFLYSELGYKTERFKLTTKWN